MTINLRYVIPIILFFVPGLLLLIGAELLGFTQEGYRFVVSVAGSMLGYFIAVMSAIFLFEYPRRLPIRVRLW